MSSLIFYTDAEQALVVTDTLAVSTDGEPMFFSSKALYLPHLRTIIAGTGLAGFASAWFNMVNSSMLVKGIEGLNKHTPEALRKGWQEYEQHPGFVARLTSTVYHFGFSEDTGEMTSFAYRSTNNFESERLGYGTGVKPECSILEGNLFENVRAMMDEQRAIQSKLPQHERLHIGGSAYALHLTGAGCSTSELFEFEDAKVQTAQAFAAFEAGR